MLKVVIFFLILRLVVERNETKKERKIVEGDKKKREKFDRTGKGSRIPKKGETSYIPENPSNQNIFGDAKRFTKVNAFLHVSKKKKKKKKKKRNASSPS